MVSHGTVKNEELQADLVVVGSGGAGLAAAAVAAQKGVNNIILLEARRTLGGNSALAGGLFAPKSRSQKSSDIHALSDELFKKAMSYAHWKTNPRLVRALIGKSEDIAQWLEEKGLKLEWTTAPQIDQTTQLSGRTRGPVKTGANIVQALAKNCEGLGVRILRQNKAKKLLISEEGKVIGVLAEAKGKEMRIISKSVIIATGGFAGNKELLNRYCPTYSADWIYLKGLPHQGDGLLMAAEAGAATDGMIVLEISPHMFLGTSHLSIIFRRPNVIWVNRKGERFTDETVIFSFPETSNSIYRQPGKTAYILFDENIKQNIFKEGLSSLEEQTVDKGSWTSGVDNDLRLYTERRIVKISDSWDEIAKWIGSDPEVLKTTIDKYNIACDNGYDDIFVKDKKYLLPLRTPPYYAIQNRLSLLVTHGGLKINHNMEVLDNQGNSIQGLYAAGNDTGDVDSNSYNVALPGHSLGFAINTGRIAGESATEFVLRVKFRE